MQTLQQIGQPAIPRLIDLLLDDNESSGLRSRITGTLAMIGDSTAIEPLITTLKDSDVMVRWHAIKALEKMKVSSAIVELEQMVANDTGEFLNAGSTVKIKDDAQKAILQIKAKQR